MAESKSHRRAKIKSAGKTGKVEAKLPSGRRPDAATSVRAVEVERGHSNDKLKTAVSRLKESRKPQKVLMVPHQDIAKAADAMRKGDITGSVRNLSGTKVVYVGAVRARSTKPSSRQRAKE